MVAVSFGTALSAVAGSVSFDFESGLPPGTSVGGTGAIMPSGGVGDSGMLRLTDAANSQLGEFFIDEFGGGAPVTDFTASFQVRMADSTCCTGPGGVPRPADGFSFNFGDDFAPGDLISAGGAEDGVGSGIRVTFDAWDSGTTDTAPAIDLVIGGTIVETQSMDGVRDGDRPPETPLITDPATGQPMHLRTDPGWANVRIQLNPDNTMDVDFKDVKIFDDVPVPGYTPVAGNFVFGARTGGANQTHWIDDLSITTNATGDIPEPATMCALALAVGGLGGYIRKRRRA
ncbi:MAG: hypothetical protein AMK72_15030 [Planctomycetes bacterium SM23_25]|nr:MAG: hypothetical protein AMK72_15030 [Planctomycetes bacterium SM23_25]